MSLCYNQSTRLVQINDHKTLLLYFQSGHIKLILSTLIIAIVNKSVASLVDYTILFQYDGQNSCLP